MKIHIGIWDRTWYPGLLWAVSQKTRAEQTGISEFEPWMPWGGGYHVNYTCPEMTGTNLFYSAAINYQYIVSDILIDGCFVKVSICRFESTIVRNWLVGCNKPDAGCRRTTGTAAREESALQQVQRNPFTSSRGSENRPLESLGYNSRLCQRREFSRST